MEVAELQRKSLIRIVDDDPLVRESLSFLLKVKGWSVIAYENAEAFLDWSCKSTSKETSPKFRSFLSQPMEK